MKKLTITAFLVVLAGVVAFLGSRFLLVTTRDAIVDPGQYLGNRQNPAEIYAGPSGGPVYCPMNLDIVEMGKLMLIDIRDDPEYAAIELQTFDDVRGRGARVILYPHQGPADSYYTARTFVVKESAHDTPYIDANMQYQLEVTGSGLQASLRMQDHEGHPIEFRVRETLRKKWSNGFLAPIGGGSAIAFEYFPLFHMKHMNFVLRKGTEISIHIAGQRRTPRKLPVPVNMELVYLTRYCPAPVIARWNRPQTGPLQPLTREALTASRATQFTCDLVNNHGHHEIRKMSGFNDKHDVSVLFSPPVPDLAGLRDGALVQGRFCAGVDDIAGILAGTYTIARQGDVIDMQIRPRKAWQPTPGPLWVKTWVWHSRMRMGAAGSLHATSGWIRQAQP